MNDTSLENSNNLTLLIKNLYQFINLKITTSKKMKSSGYKKAQKQALFTNILKKP